MKKIIFLLVVFSGLIGCYYDVKTELYGTPTCDNSVISYNGRIKTIMETNCTGCHSGNNPSAGIPLTTVAEIKTANNVGVWLCSIQQLEQCSAMPKGGKLSECEITACQLWVEAGYPEN
jgi:hypothetical protein